MQTSAKTAVSPISFGLTPTTLYRRCGFGVVAGRPVPHHELRVAHDHRDVHVRAAGLADDVGVLVLGTHGVDLGGGGARKAAVRVEAVPPLMTMKTVMVFIKLVQGWPVAPGPDGIRGARSFPAGPRRRGLLPTLTG
jgi:hypothetical protein